MSAKQHLGDYLRYNATHYPKKPAIVTTEANLSWQELYSRVEKGAQFLSGRLSTKNQQVVAILMPNSWQQVVAYLSVTHAGHIALPIDVIYKPLEINAIIKQIPPALIITDQLNRNKISKSKSPIVDITKLSSLATLPHSEYLRLPADKQIASLLFTSGTTGKPKAAPYTHANHIWNIEVCSKAWNWNHDDSLLISLRLSHWYGLVMGLSGVLYHGNTLHLQDRFDPEQTLKILASGKISLFTHTSLAYFKLLEVKGGYDLSKVRLCISGASPLPPAIWQEFKNRFGVEILECYGTSETGRIASNLLNRRIPGTPGRILPGVDIKLSSIGEVMVKSPGVFPGYFNNPTATKNGMSYDGWWRTGDIGELKDGRLVLKGRLQEKIRKNGYHISPRDIEWALHKNLAIKEVFVIGVQQVGNPNDKLVYFLVTEADEQAIRDFCQTNLPSMWRPDKIIILDDIPRTRSGKPQLARLKAMVN